MEKTSEILHKILEQRFAIINNLEEESIAVYAFLQKEFQKNKITENHVFQFVYRSFYRLDNAGLSKAFKQAYFVIMEELRHASSIDLVQIVDRLYEYPRLKGDNSVQFSFSTKLVNTINPTYPIYDSEVAKVFGFSTYHIKDKDQKMKRYLSQYQTIQDTYNVLLNDSQFLEILYQFDRRFPEYNLTPIKKIDFIFWSTGKLISKGLLF